MKIITFIMAVTANLFLFTSFTSVASGGHQEANHEELHDEAKKGPNNGKMLLDGDFALELTLFERGIPPEYRIYPTFHHKKVNVKEVSVTVTLTRLGGIVDKINFSAENDYLRGDMTVTEPHSFVVNIQAQYQGKSYQWQYDNFEGRVTIGHDMANQMEIETDIIGAKSLTETLTVYGKLTLAPNAQRHISARFPGLVKKLSVELGQQVKKGDHLLTIESDDSLQTYKIYSPISGLVTAQSIAQGEQTGTSNLLTITNTDNLIAELNVYPLDQTKVKIGAAMTLTNNENVSATSKLMDSLFTTNAQQAKIYRAKVDNRSQAFAVGQFITAQVAVNNFEVPLAVHQNALQAFRDFTVVYQKIGNQYEVRMLELGRKAGPWVEVLSGITAGSEYVIGNSYLIKADIDKAGAAHDH